MRKFFLNRQFFDFYLGCYYPLFDNIFLYVISRKTISNGHMKYNQYHCQFVVHVPSFVPNQVTSKDCFIVAFDCLVNVCNRKIQIEGLQYLMDSEFKTVQFKLFPLTPVWLIPCRRFDLWLNRCIIALRIYLKEGWLCY